MKLLSAVWILDGEVVSEEDVKVIINNNRFDTLEVKVVDGDSVQFSCKRVPLYILISTNHCLNEH